MLAVGTKYITNNYAGGAGLTEESLITLQKGREHQLGHKGGQGFPS